MNEYLASLIPAVANHLWQSTAFATAAWLLTVALRKNSARVRYGIWLAASIKFLIPFSLLIAMGAWLPKSSQSVAPTVYSAVKITEQPFADISSAFVAPAAYIPTLAQRIAAGVPAALLALWLIGAIAVVVVWCLRWRKASVSLRSTISVAEPRELLILRRLQAHFGSGPASSLSLRLSTEQIEPSVHGFFRPVLVWPSRLSDHLSDEHMEAIMAHELAHARRFDNATAALHMFVEAAFWFHPLVWWMERRMIEERERACDEAVVALGGNPDVYADGILRTCRFCLESPLPCAAGVTGADLKKRVVGIVSARTLARITWQKKIVVGAAALCLVASPVLLGQLDTPSDWEKAAGGKMSFEAASIKPINRPTGGQLSLYPGGRLVLPGFTLKAMICTAFDVSYWQILGGDGWVDKNFYNVEAKAPSNVPGGINLRHSWFNIGDPNLRLMLQSLLIERFQLKFHSQTKIGTVYALERNGKPSPLQPAKTDELFQKYGEGYSEVSPQGGVWFLTNGSTQQVANFLSGYVVHAPVLDKTGLKGAFDFRSKSQPDFDQDPAGSALSGLGELGLKLKKEKGPVEYFVIDRAEQTTPN